MRAGRKLRRLRDQLDRRPHQRASSAWSRTTACSTPQSAFGTTEELWFNEWEFKGTPWTNRELYHKWSPHMFATNFKTPILVVHGQLDYRLDVSEGFQLFTTLQRLKVPSKMLYFPDEGHWVLKPQNGRLWYEDGERLGRSVDEDACAGS